MGIGFDFYSEHGEHVCVTPAGDIPDKHIGNGRFDITYRIWDVDMTNVKRKLRLLLGGRHPKA